MPSCSTPGKRRERRFPSLSSTFYVVDHSINIVGTNIIAIPMVFRDIVFFDFVRCIIRIMQIVHFIKKKKKKKKK